MIRLLRYPALVTAVACLPSAAYPQLGEVHLGSVVSYGAPAPYGVGAGLVLGVAAGRIAYVGLRWTYHAGRTEQVGTSPPAVGARNRVQLFGADVGLQIPAGALEVVPGAELGVAWFAQRPGPAGAAPTVTERTAEFFGGPSLSIQAHVAGLVLIPEVQYQWAGNPDLPSPTSHRGPVASLRVVVPFEVDRIRY